MPPLSKPPLLPPSSPSAKSTSSGFRKNIRGKIPSNTDSPSTISQTYGNDTMKSIEQTLQEAIETYGSTHPKCSALYNKLGNVYFRERNLRQAKECYQNAVCCDPCKNTASAYLNLGTVYWSMSETANARQMLEQALACHELDLMSAGGSRSLDHSSFAASAYHQLGLCHALEQDYDQSLIFLNRALTIRQRIRASVEEGKTLAAIAKVLTMKGDKHKAALYYEQTYRILASRHALTVRHLRDLARSFEDVGDNARALAAFKELRILHERDSSSDETELKAIDQKIVQLMEYDAKHQDFGKLTHREGSLNIPGRKTVSAVM